MRRLSAVFADRFRNSLLRTAAFLVPAAQRGEWLKEWRAELWYICRNSGSKPATLWRRQIKITSFCAGSFRDAICVRRLAPKQQQAPAGRLLDSPRACILALGMFLAASYCAALLLPGVRAERSLSTFHVGPRVISIQSSETYDGSIPSISQVQYRDWIQHNQRYFDGFAFYRVLREPLTFQAGDSPNARLARWNIAHATPNLFRLLQLPPRFIPQTETAQAGSGTLILSESRWRREFKADVHVAGRAVEIGGRTFVISGVAPDALSGLPGNADAWLLEPNPTVASQRRGYAVAALSASGEALMHSSQERIVARTSRISEDDLLGVSLRGAMPDSFQIFLFSLLLALAATLAISSADLSGCYAADHRLSSARRFLLFAFLGGKIAILIPMAYFASLDLAYGCTFLTLTGSAFVQVMSVFLIVLLGIRWAFQDQRQRCPVCLHRVAHPARVGSFSRTFLAWNGVELICLKGHTLLHIPDLPTSWCSSPRWLYLDSSWTSLFIRSEGAL